ncbi:MAG: response regulator [Burkholderiaceae bacterium]
MTHAARPVNLLLVDDLDENLIALAALLKRDDVHLLEARSGAEALELLLRHPVALALVDVQMPGMDGFELAELMRGSPRTSDVPIVFLTAANADERRLFRGYESGAVDFLHKPLEPHILKRKVDVFVQLARQKQHLADELRDKSETLRFNELFNAMLGHDLRGPLSAIVMTAMVQERQAADDQARTLALRVRNNALRMSRMVADLLDLARARLGGGIPITPRAMNLADAARVAVDEVRARHPSRAIEWQAEGELDGDWDPDRIAQLLGNLLGNAAAYGDAGEPVRLHLDGRGEAMTITVANGGTIEPERMAALFDPFRPRDEGRESSDGLGLGLYIIQQIAQAHGGDVAGRSDAGIVTFEVTLPRSAPVEAR